MVSGSPPVGAAAELWIVEVGCTIVSGMLPVEAGLLSTVEDDGWTITSGSPPVEVAAELWTVEVVGTTTLGTSEEAGVLSTAEDVTAAELGAAEVGGTIMSGSRPVEPRIGPRIGLSALVEDAALLCAVGVG
jgi:hypothetical protein